MAASYPGAVKNYTSKQDGVDTILAAHMNAVQDEITAIETELGTDPAGGEVDVKTRLDIEAFQVGDLKMAAYAATPTGWLLCDGTAVSRSTYADLFASIGTAYGTGDGSTTFNVPDYRGRAPIGVGQGSGLTNRSLGDSLGVETHQLTTAEMPTHGHTVPAGVGGSGSQVAESDINGDTETHTITSNDQGSGNAHQNMQPSLAANYFIKT